MAAEKGIGFVLSKNGTQIAGLRSTGFTANGEAVEITSKDDAGWRTLLDGAGTTSVTISGAGVFQDDTALNAVMADVLTKTADAYTIDYDGGNSLAGQFQPTSLENAGEHNGEVTYTLTLESSGVITYTDAA